MNAATDDSGRPRMHCGWFVRKSSTPAQQISFAREPQCLGELAPTGREAATGPGDRSTDVPHEHNPIQRVFLFPRADTIYGGSNEVQRGIIAGRVLGLPKGA